VPTNVSFIVEQGRVELYGSADCAEQIKALGVMSQTIPGVRGVENRVVERSSFRGGY
jgi:hypothetical protein